MTVPPSTAPEPCLINYNARLYDPQIARFLSADSIIPDPTNGQSFNRYAYVANNPLNAIDPSGYVEIEQVVVTAPKCYECGTSPAVPISDIETTSPQGATSGESAGVETVIVEGHRQRPKYGPLLPLPNSSNSPSRGMSEEERETEAEEDYAICRKLASSDARARCWASAAERDGARAGGRPLPPLITWRVSTLSKSSGMAQALEIGGGIIIVGGAIVLVVLQPEVGLPAAVLVGG